MESRTRLVAGVILLGVGFGGFLDGIVLHQSLQWHHMLTATGGYPASTVAGLEANTLADGLFHAATWMAAFAGLWLVIGAMRTGAARARELLGLMLVGWGLFSGVEGVVNHQMLGIHHVNETVPETQWLAWDLGFLALGAALAGLGAILARRWRPDVSAPAEGRLRPVSRARGEAGRVKVMFFPGCLVISLVLSVVGTILINLLLRAFD